MKFKKRAHRGFTYNLLYFQLFLLHIITKQADQKSKKHLSHLESHKTRKNRKMNLFCVSL